jgi:hypothetical protein
MVLVHFVLVLRFAVEVYRCLHAINEKVEYVVRTGYYTNTT